MDTSRFVSVIASCLSTVQSWRSILAEASNGTNTSTTATASSPTIDWRTLKSCLSVLTPRFIIPAAIARPGSWWLALPAARSLNAALANIASTHTPFVPDAAMSPDGALDLRPNWEPIIVARKPLAGTVAQNVQAHGTGAINIDASRIPANGRPLIVQDAGESTYRGSAYAGGRPDHSRAAGTTNVGRWPANLIHDGSEEVLAAFPESEDGIAGRKTGATAGDFLAKIGPRDHVFGGYGGEGSAARFFYTAKASQADRNEGTNGNRNSHPTVKPSALMRYLVRLVTPPGGIVLDPFMGSGSTLRAAKHYGMRSIGIEIDPSYCAIAARRLAQEVLALE